jgi:hypothetical protein
MGALRKAPARRPLCAIIENNKCAAGADNNKERNQVTETTFTAPKCAKCGLPEEPQLINVTGFSEELPRWTIGWHCSEYNLHKYFNQQQRKQQ